MLDYSIIENRLNNRNSLKTQITSTTEVKYYKAYDKSVKPNDIDCLKLDTSNVYALDMKAIVDYIENGNVLTDSGMNVS